MGYYVKSKKINIVLAEKQQQAVLNMWMNPPSDVQENNFAMRLLPPYFKDQNLTTLKEILDMVGITYEDTKKGLKLKSHEGKLRHQRDLFDCIGHILTRGDFLTLRGEDGALMGFFFTGEKLIDYSSYSELKQLCINAKLEGSMEPLDWHEYSDKRVKRKM
jgi:hypothetical protein